MITLSKGSITRVVLPYSEVCMHLKVAGQARFVKIVGEGKFGSAAQILNDDLTKFSFPVTWGEAGIGRDGDGRPLILTHADDVISAEVSES